MLQMHIQLAVSHLNAAPGALQTAVQQALANFRLQSQTAHGTLIIRPLTQDWLQSTADLLAVSFGESMGYLPPYR